MKIKACEFSMHSKSSGIEAQTRILIPDKIGAASVGSLSSLYIDTGGKKVISGPRNRKLTSTPFNTYAYFFTSIDKLPSAGAQVWLDGG